MPEHDDDGSSPAASTSKLHDGGPSPDASMTEPYDDTSSPPPSDFELVNDDFSSPDAMSEADRGGSSPAASNSELNDIDLLSSAPSPIPSEPVSRFSTPPSSAHVASPRTPPSKAQNVGSRQGKKPSKSTPVKEVLDGKERTAARVEDLQNSYRRSLQQNGTVVELNKFLRLLLAMVLPHETPKSELQPIWDEILSVAVDICNEDLPFSASSVQSSTSSDPSAKKKARKLKGKNRNASKSKASGSTVTYKNRLQALMHSYRDTKGPESTRYAPWVRLSNHILEKLREPRYADRLTAVRLPKLEDVDASALIFQRNDNKQIKADHVGLEGRTIHKGTFRSPDVTALPIAAAIETTARPRPQSEANWKTDWEEHSLNSAPHIPHTAPMWSDILLSVEFKKQKSYEMKLVPGNYDKTDGVVDIKPRSFPCSHADGICSHARGTCSHADGTCSHADEMEFEEDEEEEEDEDEDEEKAGDDETSISQSRSKKRSRQRDYPSVQGSGKKQKSHHGQAVSGSAHEKSKSHPPPPASKARPPPPVQMAIYAAERLSSSVAVRHSIDFLVIDDMLWLWWFDRGGAIQSHGLNFIANLPYFVALLAVLQRFTPENWGQDTMFRSSSASTVMLYGPPDECDGPRPEIEINITVDKSQLAVNLFSRASCVVPAECKTDFSKYGVTNSEYVAKIYFPDETRSNEADILGEVYKIAAGENGGDVRGHVPILLAERTWRDTSADLIESILGVKRGGGSDQRKRYRNLRILLFPKLLPISDLYGLDLVMAIRSILLCHAALWQGGVHHRDISQGNLMYTIVDGRICGVLNDFDLAIIVRPGDDRKPGEERTGTRIFMAGKLVENLGKNIGILHIYDFDVESIAYVTLWLTARYDNGSLRDFPPYSTWIKLDTESLCGIRRDQLYAPNHISPSNKKFAMVFEAFFMEVHDHVRAAGRAERQGKLISPEPVEDVLRKIKASIDQPLEDLRRLTEVEESQEHIRRMSPSERYKTLFDHWSWVVWMGYTSSA